MIHFLFSYINGIIDDLMLNFELEKQIHAISSYFCFLILVSLLIIPIALSKLVDFIHSIQLDYIKNLVFNQ